MTMTIYKIAKENHAEALIEIRTMTDAEITDELRHRAAFHLWYVSALEQVQEERRAERGQ